MAVTVQTTPSLGAEKVTVVLVKAVGSKLAPSMTRDNACGESLVSEVVTETWTMVATVAEATAVVTSGFVTVTSATRVPTDGTEPDNTHVNWFMLDSQSANHSSVRSLERDRGTETESRGEPGALNNKTRRRSGRTVGSVGGHGQNS